MNSDKEDREVLIKLIAIVLLSLFSIKSFALAKVAVVKLMRGQVTASLGGKVSEIKLGDWLSPGSIVKTADQSFVKLIFVDKSNINVGPNSQMIIEKFSGNEPSVINVVKGIIRSQVTKDYYKSKEKDASKMFIKTPNAIMGIRGTEFTIGVAHKEGFEPVTSVVMIEGQVQFNDIPKGQELPESGADMDRFLKDGVAVRGGEASAVNPNHAAQPLVEPFKISLEQLNKVEKSEFPGMDHKEEKKNNSQGHESEDSRKSVLPKGLDATLVSNKPELKQVNANHSLPDASMNSHKSDKTLPGSMMDLNTGIILPPKAGSQFDAVTGTFVSSPGSVAKVNGDGTLSAPSGMEFSPKGTLIVTVQVPQTESTSAKTVHLEVAPPPANQPTKVSMESINQVFQSNPQLALQASQSGQNFNMNTLAPVVAVAQAAAVTGPKPASENTQVAVQNPASSGPLNLLAPPTIMPTNEVYNPSFVGNSGLSDLVNNSTSYNSASGSGTASEVIQQNMQNTNVNINIGVGD